MKELLNLLNFSDFKNWKPKEAKQTKRTETGLDVVNENLSSDNNYNGRYVNLEVVENGLWIHLTDEGREELNDIIERKHEYLDYEFYELFDDIRANSVWLYHDDMGEAGFGLTNAPGFTYEYVTGDDGELELVTPDSEGKIYWFPNYMVESFVETLLSEGKVFFDDGTDGN